MWPYSGWYFAAQLSDHWSIKLSNIANSVSKHWRLKLLYSRKTSTTLMCSSVAMTLWISSVNWVVACDMNQMIPHKNNVWLFGNVGASSTGNVATQSRVPFSSHLKIMEKDTLLTGEPPTLHCSSFLTTRDSDKPSKFCYQCTSSLFNLNDHAGKSYT